MPKFELYGEEKLRLPEGLSPPPDPSRDTA